MWVPPPHWLLAIGFALMAQLIVVATTFARRGRKRGALSVPAALVFFVASTIGGCLLDGALWQLDPIPLVTTLAGGVYATYALMMWRPKPRSGEPRHAV